LQNRLTEQVQKKVDLARLNGERVNIQAFVKEVVSAVADA
jgi:hypothetical protein